MKTKTKDLQYTSRHIIRNTQNISQIFFKKMISNILLVQILYLLTATASFYPVPKQFLRAIYKEVRPRKTIRKLNHVFVFFISRSDWQILVYFPFFARSANFQDSL